MLVDSLLSISPIDGRYCDKTAPLKSELSEFGLIKYRVLVEIEWFKALANCKEFPQVPPLSKSSVEYLDSLVKNFSLEDANWVKDKEKITNHDVKAVEYFIKHKFDSYSELVQYKEFIHFACTSEDINNVAYSLLFKNASSVILDTATQLQHTLVDLAHEHAATPMMSLTHGQSATPSTFGKEMANFAHRLTIPLNKIKHFDFTAKMNGAVGNFNAHRVSNPEVDWQDLSKQVLTNLSLSQNAFTTQIEPHDNLCEFLTYYVSVNTILIDFARDMWGYISRDYIKQKTIAGEVGSSTMPHKVNPIDFEQAEGNLGMANAMLQFFSVKLPISRFQRDLSDSTTLRSVGSALSYGYLSYLSLLKGLSKAQVNDVKMIEELNDHQELLSEAVQTVMRKYNKETPYEKLKELTRGKAFDRQAYIGFVSTLDIPQIARQSLIDLQPSTYLGLAAQLALKIEKF